MQVATYQLQLWLADAEAENRVAVDAYIFLLPIGRASLIGIHFFGTDRTGASPRYGGENLKLFSGLFIFLLR